MRIKSFLVVAAVLIAFLPLRAQNWPSFRGQHASGVADGKPVPASWNARRDINIAWKVPIPGLAHSSPIVWGDKVFITTAVSGAPQSDFRPGSYINGDTAEDMSKHTWKVYCLNKKTGQIVWERVAAANSPIIYKDLAIVQCDTQKGSFISSYSLKDGNRVWQTQREESSSWGSPTIVEGRNSVELVTNATNAVRSYDPLTGKELWALSELAWSAPDLVV